MNFKNFLLIPVLALIPAITGCGNDCKSLCEDGNECAGVTTKVDCDDWCDKLETLAEDADCSDKFDDLESCGADQDDVCKESTACDAESKAFGDCITPYCTKNQAACVAALGGAEDS